VLWVAAVGGGEQARHGGEGAAAGCGGESRGSGCGGESVEGERMTSQHDVAHPGLREIGG
jgi:hypothetical protein